MVLRCRLPRQHVMQNERCRHEGKGSLGDAPLFVAIEGRVRRGGEYHANDEGRQRQDATSKART